MMTETEYEILKESFYRLIENQILIDNQTQLLHTSTGISIHGSRFNNITLADSMIRDHLSASEIRRLMKLNQPNTRKQFYVGRVLAKRSLFDIINQDQIDFQSFSIENEKHGKPFFNLNDSKIKFNGAISISHKDGYVVAACRRNGIIGVDCERLARHNGVARRISKIHSHEEIRLFTELLSKSIPSLNLMNSEIVIWSALEAGFKAFSSISSKSPLEYKLSIENDNIVVHSSDNIQNQKPVFFAHAGNYILTIVA
ncbi:MAG: 4'-phosphopantetheinyl transferase family protein [Candidatus Thorarchaeota archaeon]